MGQLKDAVFLQVWKHLQSQLGSKTTLVSLGVCKEVRDAWMQLQSMGLAEGVDGSATMKTVLSERADLFDFPGIDVVELTEAAQIMDPLLGLPANILTSDGGLAESEATVDSVVVAAPPGAAPKPVGQVGQGPPAPKARSQRVSTYSLPGKSKGRGKNGMFSDLVWTPLISLALDAERRKDHEMVRALHNAVEMHTGKAVTLSQLGSDFKVSQLKKDICSRASAYSTS